jgi:predicted nucleic acid-binding protein
VKDVRSGEHAVIDAGIAVKWVVEEDGTREALVLRQKAKLIASDLLVDECANTFWKKVQRRELLKAEALLGTRSISMTQFSGLMTA